MHDNNKKNNHPNPAVIEKFLALQEQEIVMRGKELEIQQQGNNNSHEYAKAALQANKEDREATRNHKIQSKKLTFLFSGIVFVFFIAFLTCALLLNKDEIVKEIIKAVIYVSTSGIGGYFIGKNKGHKIESPD